VIVISVKLVWNASLLQNLIRDWKREFYNSSLHSHSPGTFKIYHLFMNMNCKNWLKSLF